MPSCASTNILQLGTCNRWPIRVTGEPRWSQQRRSQQRRSQQRRMLSRPALQVSLHLKLSPTPHSRAASSRGFPKPSSRKDPVRSRSKLWQRHPRSHLCRKDTVRARSEVSRKAQVRARPHQKSPKAQLVRAHSQVPRKASRKA